jgi:hypothetical protein
MSNSLQEERDRELLESVAKLRFPITGVETDGAQKYYTFKSDELYALLPIIKQYAAKERKRSEYLAQRLINEVGYETYKAYDDAFVSDNTGVQDNG